MGAHLAITPQNKGALIPGVVVLVGGREIVLVASSFSVNNRRSLALSYSIP